jgi:hypothetical protein
MAHFNRGCPAFVAAQLDFGKPDPEPTWVIKNCRHAKPSLKPSATEDRKMWFVDGNELGAEHAHRRMPGRLSNSVRELTFSPTRL